MSTLYILCPQELVKQKERINLKTTLNQEFQEIGVRTLLQSSRSVHAVGVSNPVGAVINTEAEMKLRCKSRVSWSQ
jgi:hypothetical protein